MKIIKKLVLVSLLGSSLLAADNQFYMGLGLNSGSVTRDYYNSNNYLVGSVNGNVKGKYLKIGYITKTSNRLEFMYSSEKFTNNNNSSDSDTITSFTFNGIVTITSFSNSLLLPYWTGGFSIDKSKNADKTGVGVNVGLGLYINVLKNIELDTSYKFKITETQLDNGYYMDDSYGTFNFGVNYKF